MAAKPRAALALSLSYGPPAVASCHRPRRTNLAGLLRPGRLPVSFRTRGVDCDSAGGEKTSSAAKTRTGASSHPDGFKGEIAQSGAPTEPLVFALMWQACTSESALQC